MVEGAYFDGKTSRRQAVRLAPAADGLDVIGEDWRRREALAGIRVSEPLGGAPRTLSFADGAYCEVAQGSGLDALLAAIGHRDRAVARWQASWRIALAALVGTVVILSAGYRWGLPWAAAQAAARLPPAAVAGLSDNVLQLLDRQALAPSRLSEQRQHEIERGFRRLVAGDPALEGGPLLFRRAVALGANAFALPDGRIVLFDELVELADSDAEVMAVLAHELGHARNRHGLRQLIQSSVVAVVAAAWFGDVSSLLSGLSGLLLESRYSRGFEAEADAYGARLLRQNGYSPEDLAAMLEKLEKAHAGGKGGGDWLSSHPDTARRVERLRAVGSEQP